MHGLCQNCHCVQTTLFHSGITTFHEMDEQDQGLEGPMNSLRRTVRQATLRLLPIALTGFLTAFLTILLTIAPPASSAAGAQTLLEAGRTAAAAAAQSPAQPTACVAQAQELLKECEEEERKEAENGLPDRTGLGWTGIGLASAGVVQTGIGLNVSRWRSCGPGSVRHCRNLERVYRLTGGMLLATGVTYFVIDEVRRHRKRVPARQTVVDIGPTAIQVRVLF
jgi:hypothetical protein